MMWLYETKAKAEALDEAVQAAKGWPDDDTRRWSEPSQVDRDGHALEGMWYVTEPEADVREEVRAECPPDLEREYSPDWHPDPELV